MEALSTHADGFAESFGTDWTDHELLERDGRVRVRAAVDDVHHGNGQHLGVGAADVFVKRQTECIGGCVCDCEGNTEHGVGTELALVGCAVEGEHGFVDRELVAGVEADEFGSDDVVDIVDRFQDALAEVAGFVAVA